MKFRNAINKLTLFGLLAFSVYGCENLQYPVSETHTYQYTRVTKNRETLFSVQKGDTMNVNSDGSFFYVIKSAGKNAYGKWKLLTADSTGKNAALEFTYSPDNQKRIFEICRYNRKTLILCEGPLRFEYKRIR